MLIKAFEILRKQIFWILDFLQGSKIKNHLNDIGLIQESNFGSNPVIQERLSKIIQHCVNSTNFYENLKSENSITNFPIINKNIIRENINQFISNKFSKEQLIPLITSGSTGTPFKVFHDKNKRKRNTSDTIYFANQAGYKIGNKLYYFKIWSLYNKKGGLQKWLQNIVDIDVLNLSKNCSNILQQLKRNKSAISLIGYVSAFETICKYLDKNENGNNFGPVNSIITMSESLNDYTKLTAEKYFSCPVLSRYSNIENGIIAQQTLNNQIDFEINIASYLVEIFHINEDKVLPNGKLGRIVVTDYFNFGMPMIRYDTGDLGILEVKNINGNNKLVLSKIEGRKLDQIYDPEGNLISSYIVYKNMWNYTEIEQYQFIQLDINNYLFKICINGDFKRENQLISEFRKYLGEKANFKVEYVNEIPLLDSGKRKKVVNLMNN